MPKLQDNSVISTACMEHQVLQHIKQAIRVTLDWQAPEVSLPRKLSSLQFTIKSFQRHLERVMSIEEEGGYMAGVVDEKPYMQDRIDDLAGDHARFRARLRRLMPELDRINEWETSRFEAAMDDLRSLIDEVDEHDEREINLLLESISVDDGGEG
jgi:hemerythrin-like domain-containing protein